MNHGTSPNTPGWEWALRVGAVVLAVRALNSSGGRKSTGPNEIIRVNQSTPPNRSFPWGKLAVGGLIGYGVLKLAPKVFEYLDSLPSLPSPTPPIIASPSPQISIDPKTSGHPGQSNRQFNFPASDSDSTTGPPAASWTPAPDARWIRVAPHPSIIVVLGMRGSGKSALGYRLGHVPSSGVRVRHPVDVV